MSIQDKRTGDPVLTGPITLKPFRGERYGVTGDVGEHEQEGGSKAEGQLGSLIFLYPALKKQT